MATWTDGCLEDVSTSTSWDIISTNCPLPGSINGSGLYTANSGVACSEDVLAYYFFLTSFATINIGPCGVFDHYGIGLPMYPIEEGYFLDARVVSVDNCGASTVIPGETVTPSGDCDFRTYPLINSPFLKTVSDTSGDTTNGEQDLQDAEGTFADPVGKYIVPGGTSMSVRRPANMMLGTLNSVFIYAICGRSANVRPDVDAVRYSLDGGLNFTNTAITCADSSPGAYKPLQTAMVAGITGWESIQNLVIEYSAAGVNASRHIGFDTLILEYSVSAMFADQIPCTAGGACTLTSGDIGGLPVMPLNFPVMNDDSITTVNVTPDGPIMMIPYTTQAFTCTATCSDAFTESCDAALVDDFGWCGYLDGNIYHADATYCQDQIDACWQGVCALPTIIQMGG